MISVLKKCLFVSCLIISASAAVSNAGDSRSMIGRVISVISGDTVQLQLPGGEVVRVKLVGVRAPGADNPFAKASHRWLSSQLKNQLVSAKCVVDQNLTGEIATYRCILFPDDRDINQASLYFGYTLHEMSELKFYNDVLYRAAQGHAQKNKIGVCALVNKSSE